MWGFFFEAINASLVVVIFIFLVLIGRREEYRSQKGWRCIVTGYAFIFLALLFDLGEHVPPFASYAIFGRTPIQAFLEKVVGELTGYSLIFIGFLTWLPTVSDLKKAKRDLKRNVFALEMEIRDRHKAEEKIRVLNRELEDRVAARTAQLEATNKELESFSYTVSHDLRAPLTRIMGFSQLLKEECGFEKDAHCLDYLEKVIAGATQMGELIEDLLSFSRVARAELQVEEIDLSAEAQVITADLQLSDPVRQADIVVEPSVKVNGDPKLIKVALQNLLHNAWKYTSKENISRIEFRAFESEGETGFLVRDNGVGFDMAEADRLFGVFQRLHENSEFPGTGIGLANVQRIVQRHGGRIWAEAAVGQGACFYVTFETI